MLSGGHRSRSQKGPYPWRASHFWRVLIYRGFCYGPRSWELLRGPQQSHWISASLPSSTTRVFQRSGVGLGGPLVGWFYKTSPLAGSTSQRKQARMAAGSARPIVAQGGLSQQRLDGEKRCLGGTRVSRLEFAPREDRAAALTEDRAEPFTGEWG